MDNFTRRFIKMSFKKSLLLISFLIVNNIRADDSYIDDFHNTVSDSVFSLSKSIDQILSGSYGEFNPAPDTYDVENQKQKPKESLDSFFKTNKYLDETEKTFLRVNFNTLTQTKGSNDFGYRVKARLPLSRTKKNYNLFIDDFTNESPNSEITNQSTDNAKTSVGLNFFAPETLGIDSKYSVGVRGFKPFIRARYNLDYTLGSWGIQPVQIFKYSSDKKFEEETNLYFDKKIMDTDLLRFALYRHTQEKVSGMDYAFSAQYFVPLKNQAALSISQAFIGNTKYIDIPYGSPFVQNHNTYGGINNYATNLSYRENIWKKWFFYQVSPGFNFHRQHNYKANYSINFSIEMYFGKTYKQ